MDRVPVVLAAVLLLSFLPAAVQEAVAVTTEESPYGVGVNTTTNRIYVANYVSRTVSVIAGDTSQVVATIPMPGEPTEVAANRVTNRIYVVILNTNDIVEIDGETISIAMIPVGHFSNGLAVNDVTNRIYTTDQLGYAVTVIDGATRRPIANIPVAALPEGIGVNASTNRVFVVSTGAGGILSIISGARDLVIDTIPLASQPRQVGVDAVRNLIYVTNSSADYVWLLDGRTRTVITTIRVKDGPLGIAVNANSNQVYVADILQDAISIIHGKERMVSTVRVGHSPTRVGVNELAGSVYVSNAGNSNVSSYAENDLLRDGTFDREKDGRPVRWASQNLGIDDRLVGGDHSQFPYDGKWAFQFVGQTGVDKRLIQTIDREQPAGTRFRLEGFSKAEDAGPGGRYEIEVSLTYRDAGVDVFRIQFPDGTHEWVRRAKTFIAPKDVRASRVSVIYADQPGRGWFDAVHLRAETP